MEAFLEECGASGPLKIEVDEPERDGILCREFDQPFAIIGRDEDADVRLDHDLVSRRHTYLQVIDSRVFFVDLESRTGTAGDAGSKAGWLTPGESLTIGPYRVRAVAAGEAGGLETSEESNPLSSRPPDAVSLPAVSLEFETRKPTNLSWRMSPVLALVGTSERCKVRLHDPSVSRIHCALLRTSQGLWAVDLMSRTGMVVNGARVRCSRLVAGDVLRLGTVIVHPRFGGLNGQADGSRISQRNGTDLEPVRLRRNLETWAPSQRTAVGSSTERLDLAQIPAGRSDVPATADPALSLLLGHFGQMQQQMLDQFQQSMMMMMQMFGGMHRDQMGLLREEIAKLGELNTEIASIKAELAARPAAAPPVNPAPLLPFGAPRAGASAPAWMTPRSEPPVSAPFPARAATQPPSAAVQPSPPPAAFVSPAEGAPSPSQRPLKDEAPAQLPDPVVHDWLNDRLAVITKEQQTRWQKIMSIMSGSK